MDTRAAGSGETSVSRPEQLAQPRGPSVTMREGAMWLSGHRVNHGVLRVRQTLQLKATYSNSSHVAGGFKFSGRNGLPESHSTLSLLV